MTHKNSIKEWKIWQERRGVETFPIEFSIFFSRSEREWSHSTRLEMLKCSVYLCDADDSRSLEGEKMRNLKGIGNCVKNLKMHCIVVISQFCTFNSFRNLKGERERELLWHSLRRSLRIQNFPHNNIQMWREVKEFWNFHLSLTSFSQRCFLAFPPLIQLTQLSQ